MFSQLFSLNQQAKISFEKNFTNFEMTLIYPPTSLWFLGRLIFQFPPKVSKFEYFRNFHWFFKPMSKQFHVSETFENIDPVPISKLISWFQHNQFVKNEKSYKMQAKTADKSEVILIFFTKKVWFLNLCVSTNKLKWVLWKSSPTSKWSIITKNFPVVPRETDWSISSNRV